MILWRLDRALSYIRGLQPRAMDTGWCIFLGGGVLNNGFSANDLDLFAYPRTPDAQRGPLLALLPRGRWSYIKGVSEVYSYDADCPTMLIAASPVDLIFQIPVGSAQRDHHNHE